MNERTNDTTTANKQEQTDRVPFPGSLRPRLLEVEIDGWTVFEDLMTGGIGLRRNDIPPIEVFATPDWEGIVDGVPFQIDTPCGDPIFPDSNYVASWPVDDDEKLVLWKTEVEKSLPLLYSLALDHLANCPDCESPR